jgi:hypothetical protein
MLIVGPTGFVLRGYALNATSQKDHIDLWKVVMPLHRPFEHVILNYGEIISGPVAGRFCITRPIPDDRVAVLSNAIERHLASLRTLEGPSDFLAHIARMSGNRSDSVQLDFALTHYLVGNVDAAHRILRSLEASLDTVPQRRVIVRQALDRLTADPASLRALIDHWRDENITTFRLEASLQKPSHLRPVKSD